jgi:hypothetical protein
VFVFAIASSPINRTLHIMHGRTMYTQVQMR